MYQLNFLTRVFIKYDENKEITLITPGSFSVRTGHEVAIIGNADGKLLGVVNYNTSGIHTFHANLQFRTALFLIGALTGGFFGKVMDLK